MRYEVRKPDGTLIGLYNGPALGSQMIKFDALPPLGAVRDYGMLTYPSVQEIVLESCRMNWSDGTVIPTLVLRKGKRSWLNKVKGFRRI